MDKFELQKKVESILTVDFKLEWSKFGLHRFYCDPCLWFDEVLALSRFLRIDCITWVSLDNCVCLEIRFWIREIRLK